MDPGTDLTVEKPGHRSGGRPGDSTGHRKAGDSAVTGYNWGQCLSQGFLGTDVGTGNEEQDFLARNGLGQKRHRRFVVTGRG